MHNNICIPITNDTTHKKSEEAAESEEKREKEKINLHELYNLLQQNMNKDHQPRLKIKEGKEEENGRE